MADMKRYQRQILLSEVGLEGQQKLIDSSVLIIGAGGLGCPVALYLAASGIGTIGLVDNDHVDISNLHRQILYTVDDIGMPKVEAGKNRLLAYNPNLNVIAYKEQISSKNANKIIPNFDLVIDCTDNFPARYLINDACVIHNKINIYASIFQFEGQVSVFNPSSGPCYRCLFSSPPKAEDAPNCAEAGVLGVLPGVLGLAQANEAIKILLNMGNPLVGRLKLYDALSASWNEFVVEKNEHCPICSKNRTIHNLTDYNYFCQLSQHSSEYKSIKVGELKSKIQCGDDLVILDVRTTREVEILNFEKAINIPLDNLKKNDFTLSYDKNTELIVLCQNGPRSIEAIKYLLELGYVKSSYLEGGLTAWEKAA